MDLTYKSRNNLRGKLGCRVLVLVRNSLRIGLLYKETVPTPKAKEIVSLIDEYSIVTKDLLKMTDWMSSYYLTDEIQVLKNIISPDYFKIKNLNTELTPHYYKQKSSGLILLDYNFGFTDEDLRLLEIFEENSSPFSQKGSAEAKHFTAISSRLGRYIEAGYVELSFCLDNSVLKKKALFYTLNKNCLAKGKGNYKNLINRNERSLLAFFTTYLASELRSEWLRYQELNSRFKISRAAINKLVQRNLLLKEEFVVNRIPGILNEKLTKEEIIPSPEQQNIIDQLKIQLDQNDFKTSLLFGVTGSGKTLVYVKSVSYALSQGKNVLILLPEIALTPQLVRIFNSLFPGKVAVIHSNISKGEKTDIWENILKGSYRIVVGARSGIFAPISNLGLVIVDEEHEGSYKQSEREPCYHGRDLAVYRAMLNKAVCLLGSATPSLESYTNALEGKYELLKLTNRVPGAFLPKIMTTEIYSESSEQFSLASIKKMQEILDKGKKIIIFMNRRGFASHLICNNCKNIPTCKNCSVSLTYHKGNKQLVCHHCGYAEKAHDYCQACGEQIMEMKGVGTEKIVTELEKLFPEHNSLRMDYDNTRTKNAHDKLIEEFKGGKYDFLVGTQMIAKGLNFPEVELVVVINALQESLIPDFKSDERNFQILCQVAGRAGRKSQEGMAILQSFDQEHPLLKEVIANDYESFYQQEINNRKQAQFPPAGKMLKVSFFSKSLAEARKVSTGFYQEAAEKLKQFSDVNVLPPMDSLIAKIKNYYRIIVIVRIFNTQNIKISRVKNIVAEVIKGFRGEQKVRLLIDVDPVSAL